MALSSAKRELLIRIGLAQNDLLLVQRFWGALYYRNPRSLWATEAHAVQQITFLLVLVGKLFEALEIFRKRFSSNAVSRAYLKQFNARQLKAVDTLKAGGGKNNLLASIRNDFAFHYHDKRPLGRFMSSWPPERLLTMYFGDPDVNTLNAYAAEPFLRALMRRTRRRTPNAALRYIQNEAAAIIAAHSTFVAAIQVLMLKEICGSTPEVEELAIGDDEYLPHDQWYIPFFTGIPSRCRAPYA
jgi:hypothetical protein